MFKELLQRDTMLWLADTVQDALAKEVAEGDRAGRRGPAEDQVPGTEDLTSADYAAALSALRSAVASSLVEVTGFQVIRYSPAWTASCDPIAALMASRRASASAWASSIRACS